MSTDLEVQASDLGARPDRSGSRRRFLWVAVALVVVVVLAGAAWLWVVVTRPDPLRLFGGHGDSAFVSDAKIGQAFYFDSALGTDRQVDIDSIAPVVRVNTARAIVQVVVCAKVQYAGSDGVGAVSGAEVGQYCSSLQPVRSGQRLSIGYDGPNQLLYAITPHTSGRVTIDGVRFAYHQGDRHGHEQCGLDVRLATSKPN